MKILISSVFCILFLFTGHTGAKEELPTPQVTLPTPVPPAVVVAKPDFISQYALLYGANEQDMRKVMKCESGGRQSAVGDGGRAFGVYQFHKATFDAFSKRLGETLDINSEHDQIKLAAYMFANGHGNNWTAYRALKNGGTYSFYSKLLEKHFTVTCR